MATKRRRRSKADGARPVSGNGSNGATPMSGLAGQPTGRYLVTLKEGAEKAGQQAVMSALGVRTVAATADYKEGTDLGQIASADAAVLSELGVLIVAADAAA